MHEVPAQIDTSHKDQVSYVTYSALRKYSIVLRTYTPVVAALALLLSTLEWHLVEMMLGGNNQYAWELVTDKTDENYN